MEISTSTNICAFQAGQERNPLEFCIAECAKAGYKVLDINFCEAMNPNSRMRGDNWEDYVRDIGAVGKRWGVIFRQSHLPYYDIFADNDSDKVKTMEELIRRSIIASAMLGVEWTVTHPGTVYSAGPDMSVSLERNVEYYSVHVETARKCGMGIALENEFEYRSAPYQHMFCASAYELVQLVDSLGDPKHVGVCYDFGHGNLVGGFHRQSLNIIGQRLQAIHVQDNHGLDDEHLMPFHGNINWEDAMAGLADIDYKGDLTYEIQEFGRYFPNDRKYLVIEYSLRVGQVLVEMFENARATRQ
ncbi:MAG: sugar phosphate isomerase/epimerase [Bacillota bacterium]